MGSGDLNPYKVRSYSRFSAIEILCTVKMVEQGCLKICPHAISSEWFIRAGKRYGMYCTCSGIFSISLIKFPPLWSVCKDTHIRTMFSFPVTLLYHWDHLYTHEVLVVGKYCIDTSPNIVTNTVQVRNTNVSFLSANKFASSDNRP